MVVVTWNGAYLLDACLGSLRTQTLAHELIVVDNASRDDTAELLAEKFPEAKVIERGMNTGFAGGAQAGLAAATTPYVAFLNNDAFADQEWLAALVAELDADPSVTAVTSRILLADDGRINNAGGALTRWGVGYDRGYECPDGPQFRVSVDVAAFCGAAAALRADVARSLGGFPAEFFLYYEDTDLSWRLGRAGGRIRYVPGAVVYHRHSASSDQTSASFAYYNQRNQLLMLLRNAPWALIAMVFARYLAGTGIAVVRNMLPGSKSSSHQARPVHRLRILRDVVNVVPWTVRERRRIERTSTMSRREYRRRWLGVEAR